MNRILIIFTALFISCTFANAQETPRIQGWNITQKKDAFGEKDTYLAARIQDGEAIILRCLQGDRDILLTRLSVTGRFKETQKFQVKYKIDQMPIETTYGVAVNERSIQIDAEDNMFEKLKKSKEIALRVTSTEDITYDLQFKIPNVGKVVEAVNRACKIN